MKNPHSRIRKPADFDAVLEKAIGLFNSGQYHMAISVAEGAVRMRPPSVDALRLLCDSYFSLEQYDLAEKYMRAAVAIAPLSDDVSESLYLILSASGQTQQAVEEIRRFLLLADSPIHEEFLTGYLKALRWVPGEEAAMVQLMKREMRSGDMAGFDKLANKIIAVDERFRDRSG